MHRAPIKLNEPSYTWDRNLPDHVLFEKALNTANVYEMIYLLERIDYEVTTFERFRSIAAISDFNDGNSLLISGNEDGALEIFEKIILQAPRYCKALLLALQARANIFYKRSRFDGAANDYELLILLTGYDVDNIAEVYGRLVICHYLLGKYDRAKEWSQLYTRNLEIIENSTIKGRKIQEEVDLEIEMMSCTVNKLMSEIHDQFSTPSPPKIKQENFHWTQLSTECIGKGQYRMCANANIRKDTVVLQERPVAQTMCVPYVMCELCLNATTNLYTCLDCRIRTYCSPECMRNDYLHEEECIGMKSLLVYMLNAQQLFKAFIELLHLIYSHLLTNKDLIGLKTVSDLLPEIRKRASNFDNPLLRLISLEYNFEDVSDKEFSTIVTTSVRLALFIVEKTEVLRLFRNRVDVSPKQELIFVGALLMQLQYYLLRNSQIIRFEIPARHPQDTENWYQLYKRICDGGLILIPKLNYETVFECYNIDYTRLANKATLLLKSLDHMIGKVDPTVQSTSRRNKFVPPMLEFCDFIAKQLMKDVVNDNDDDDALSIHIAQMDNSKLAFFLSSYAKEFCHLFYDYIYQYRVKGVNHPLKQTALLFGHHLGKFRHSCDPNIEIIYLKNGLVIGKTLKPLRKGDECFVSYRTKFNTDNYKTRVDILKQYNVQCDCKYCKMPDNNNFNLQFNIYCVPKCGTEFGKVEGMCPKCGLDYEMLLAQYANTLTNLEDSCPIEDEMVINQHWIVLMKAYDILFPPYSEYRTAMFLKYGKFIAMSNFFTQAYELVVNTYTITKQYYAADSEVVLFGFYNEMIEIIRMLLVNNIDERLNNTPPNKLMTLNNLALDMLHAQLAHLKLYEKFDQNSGIILQLYRYFLNWRKEITCMMIPDSSDMFKYFSKEPRAPGLEVIKKR